MSSMAHTACRLILVIPLAALVACGKSPEARAKEAATALRSWQATARLVEEQRARGALPAEFTAQAARAGEQERAQAERQLRDASAP
jgi:hypothetical protein